MAADRLKGGFLPQRFAIFVIVFFCQVYGFIHLLLKVPNCDFIANSVSYISLCVHSISFSSSNHIKQLYWFFFSLLLQKIDAQAIEEFYGLTSDISKNSESGYILFYQSRE